MRDSNILSYEQVVQINLTLQKENDLLKQQNIELRNSLTELKEYYQSLDKFAATVYDPKKATYKELEQKLALAENSKQTEIDELYETKIGPLPNKVKDQHIQLESQYKRETKLQQEIKNLKDTIHDAETVINFAVGYISATQPHTDKHPMEVKKWLYEGVFREIQNNN